MNKGSECLWVKKKYYRTKTDCKEALLQKVNNVYIILRNKIGIIHEIIFRNTMNCRVT